MRRKIAQFLPTSRKGVRNYCGSPELFAEIGSNTHDLKNIQVEISFEVDEKIE